MARGNEDEIAVIGYGGTFIPIPGRGPADVPPGDVSALILVRFCRMMRHTLSTKEKARTGVHHRAAFHTPVVGETDDNFSVEF
jgi:hypothetical protein